MKLSKKDIWLNIIFPLCTFFGGILVSFLLSIIVHETETKIIQENKIDGYHQTQIKKIPYIQSFFKYLTSIENKDESQIWNHMTHDLQNSYGHPRNLKYAYYLTNNYDVKYIIPISENHFYVFLRFEDDVVGKEVENIKSYSDTKLANLISDSLPSALQAEVYQFIDNRFVIDNSNQVQNEISNHLNKMTMKEFVNQDWRFPLNIASKLQLAPKPLNSNCYNYRQGHYMISEVIMENENDIWKVKKFETIAISRWK